MLLEKFLLIFSVLKIPVKNKISYLAYTWKQKPAWRSVIQNAILIVSVITLVMDLMDFIDGSIGGRLVYIAGILLPGILNLFDYADSYGEKYRSMMDIPGAYENIEPAGGDWKRHDLMLNGGNFQPVMESAEINEWLRGTEPIQVQRDRGYEKLLRDKIVNPNRWNGVYYPFLERNHSDSMYHGRQFNNEKKYGLSRDLDPSKSTVYVHKTCYYDSYLTNIIPGKMLISNQYMDVVADTVELGLLPYTTYADGRKVVKSFDNFISANEPGVTTLCFVKTGLHEAYIHFWRQNRMAMSSVGQMVATGSGSADWRDVKQYIGQENGLRKAVVYGMERELWEESFGMRNLSRRDFMQQVDTRILGFFRWMKKGAKAEFVGISRFRDERMRDPFYPEENEVQNISDGVYGASSIAELRRGLSHLMTPKEDGTIEVTNCSVSCIMAVKNLLNVSEGYCICQCPKREHCDRQENSCDQEPYEVLFPEELIVKI